MSISPARVQEDVKGAKKVEPFLGGCSPGAEQREVWLTSYLDACGLPGCLRREETPPMGRQVRHFWAGFSLGSPMISVRLGPHPDFHPRRKQGSGRGGDWPKVLSLSLAGPPLPLLGLAAAPWRCGPPRGRLSSTGDRPTLFHPSQARRGQKEKGEVWHTGGF